MDINTLEDKHIDWESIPAQKTPGASGYVLSKAMAFSNLRIRKLEFSANYMADHWCQKGHVIHVLKGELIIIYENGSHVIIKKDCSLILADNISSHKAKTSIGTQIFIID